jgi:D-serine dehydratase
LALIDQWHTSRQPGMVLDVLLEIGFAGGRTGCRTVAQAVELANALHQSKALRLCGLECYEGGLAHCDSQADSRAISEWITMVQQAAAAIDAQGHFDGEQVLLSAGGSAVFDLVMPLLCHTRLSRPVQGILRSGCTITHDHFHYKRYFSLLAEREQLKDGLQPALEVWTVVQSVPEPGLALLNAGRRDLSFDVALPQPVRHVPHAQCAAPEFFLDLTQEQVIPKDWRINALNDHHAYLVFDPQGAQQPQVGDRVALGISHPCTTFDKWTWLALVNDQGQLVDVVTTYF